MSSSVGFLGEEAILCDLWGVFTLYFELLQLLFRLLGQVLVLDKPRLDAAVARGKSMTLDGVGLSHPILLSRSRGLYSLCILHTIIIIKMGLGILPPMDWVGNAIKDFVIFQAFTWIGKDI